jgi:hypothetical protein
VAVVHNGIIENYESLRNELDGRGHEFESETDTEVVPHLVEERLESGPDPEAAFREVVERLEGSYALAVAVEGEDAVFATRNGSPLVVGVGDAANYLASDIPAFLEFTDSVRYLQDDDVAVVEPDDVTVTDLVGDPIVRERQTVDWAADDVEKSGYNDYMLKEIKEQPVVLRQAVRGRTDPEDSRVPLEDLPAGPSRASTGYCSSPAAPPNTRRCTGRRCCIGGACRHPPRWPASSPTNRRRSTRTRSSSPSRRAAKRPTPSRLSGRPTRRAPGPSR